MEYQVIANEFHGGHPISQHRSLRAALKSALKHNCTTCTCGGVKIDGVNYDILTAYDYHKNVQGLVKPEAIEAALKEETWRLNY